MTAQVVTDRHTWDAAIARLNGHLLQTWRWGTFKSAHGWNPVRVLLASGDEPVAAAQVLLRRIGPVAVAYVPRGPAAIDLGAAPAAALTTAVDRVSRRARAAALFLEPDVPLSLPRSGRLALRPSSTVFQPLRTIKVPVNRSDDDLLGAMKAKTRYNVRLAQRRGVTVRCGSLTDLPAFYRLLEETGRRDNFGIHSVEYYRDMLATFGPDAGLLLAEYDSEPVAAAIVVRHGAEAIYLYGASTQRYQRHMPTYLVQFEAMRWARERGCLTYDLWGIPTTEAPPEDVEVAGPNVRAGLWGVYRFKQGFGGQVVEYPGVLERIYLPPLVRLWRLARPGVE